MKRSFLLFLSLLSFLFSCTSSFSPEQEAASAAKDYYDCLVAGNTTGFLEGKAGVDALPADYAEQLLQATQLYVDDIQRRHGGLQSVSVSPNVGRRDSTLHLTYAFLMLSYNDSTQEEITVPMVDIDGRWCMK